MPKCKRRIEIVFGGKITAVAEFLNRIPITIEAFVCRQILSHNSNELRETKRLPH